MSEADITNKVEHSKEQNITKLTDSLSEVDLTENPLHKQLCYQPSLGSCQTKSDEAATCLSNLPKLSPLSKLCNGVKPDGACAWARSHSGFSLVPREAWCLSLGRHRLLSSYLVHMIKSYPSAITPLHWSIPKPLAISHLSHLELTCWYTKGLYSIPFLLPFRDVYIWKCGFCLSIFRVV